jgi:hypothetical protein
MLITRFSFLVNRKDHTASLLESVVESGTPGDWLQWHDFDDSSDGTLNGSVSRRRER